MSELFFGPSLPTPPFDPSGELTEWFGIGTAPTASTGALYPSRVLDGTNGYYCAAPEELNGISTIAVSVDCAPDFVALDGAGRVTLVSIGRGGPSLNGANSWGFAIRVTGAVLELLGWYQDLSLVVQEVAIASVPVPTGTWHRFSFSREIAGGTGHWLAGLDGVAVGTASAAIAIPFISGADITYGYRDNLGTGTEFFRGELETAVIEPGPWTGDQVRHDFLRRDLVGESTARLRDLLPSIYPKEDGSVYHDLRIRPAAMALALVEAGTRAVDENAVIRPYGAQLERWVSATDLRPAGDLSVAETQAQITARMADRGGFVAERMIDIAAGLTGADVADIDLLENQNQISLSTVSVSDAPASGGWLVRGLGTADLTATGLRLHALAGRDLSWALSQRSLEAGIAVASIVAPETGRQLKAGLAADLVSISGSVSDAWVGMTVVGSTTAVHVGVYGAGPSYTLAYRTSTSGTAYGSLLGAWTALGTLAAGDRLALTWVPALATWAAVVETTPGDPETQTVYPLAGVPTDVSRIGLSIVSDGALASDVSATWSPVRAAYPDAATGKYYFLVAPTATTKDHTNHTNALRANDRPTVQGAITYGDPLEADSTDTVADYSSMSDVGNPALAIPDNAIGTIRLTTREPAHLWTFQEASGSLVDRRNRTRFAVTGANHSYGVAGPLDRVAFAWTDDSVTGDYALADRATIMNSGSGTALLFVGIYRYDPIAPVADCVLRKRQTASSKQYQLSISASTNWAWNANDGGATSSTLNVPVTAGAWAVVACSLEHTTGNTYTLNVATDTASDTVTTAFATTLSTNNPLSLGDDSGTLETAAVTWRWLACFTGSEVAGLADSDLQEICRRVAGTL